MAVHVLTLKNSAHEELKRAYPQVALLGFLLASALHVIGLALSPPTGPTPIRLPVASAEPTRVLPVDYDVIPEAPAPVRPPLEDLVFDEMVSDPLRPLVEPRPSEPTWADPVLPGAGASDGAAEAGHYLVAPEMAPELLHHVPPRYPELARLAEAEGSVLLELRIGADGRVEEVTILASDALASLEKAAVTAAQGWIFSPARQGGRSVPVRIRVPIESRLH